MNTETPTSPEIGKSCAIAGATINYHDLGQGEPLLLIHGSGPGVSAWANWRGVMPDLSTQFRVIAPDMIGFGHSRSEVVPQFDVDRWVGQVVALLDALGLDRVNVVGNSFGGAIALHLARRHPGRVHRLALMGAVSLSFQLTRGLDLVWGYRPSPEAMRDLMKVFAHDQSLISEDLIASRYQVSMQRGMDKVYESLFPAPRQRWVEALAHSEEQLREVKQPTLIMHGREDQVIPLEISLRLMSILPNPTLLVFGNCGHWTQIEKREAFIGAVTDFMHR